MEEETKLETPEEKAHRKERERFMRQAITQAKKAEKLTLLYHPGCNLADVHELGIQLVRLHGFTWNSIPLVQLALDP